jgi:hypothetical protein
MVFGHHHFLYNHYLFTKVLATSGLKMNMDAQSDEHLLCVMVHVLPNSCTGRLHLASFVWCYATGHLFSFNSIRPPTSIFFWAIFLLQ